MTDAQRVQHPHPGGPRDDKANQQLVSSIVRDRTSSFVSNDFLF